MSTNLDESEFCSIRSEQTGEHLIGSAPFTETYLVIETPEPFGKVAFEESLIPVDVKIFLKEKLSGFPNARLLLGHGPHQPFPGGPRFFLARTTDPRPVLYEFKLRSYEDLLQIDFQAILSNAPANAINQRKEPIYLVCTNGKRDPCCAKFGLPIFNEIKTLHPDSVWQSSHMGGHRFGPLLLILPHGLVYGRLGTYDAREAVEAYSRGEVYLPRLRGRATYPQAAQVAEFFIRQANDLLDLRALQLMDAHEIRPGQWSVIFINPETGRTTRVVVAIEKTEQKVFESCQSEKQTFLTKFSLVYDG